jgi:hypothetical protein
MTIPPLQTIYTALALAGLLYAIFLNWKPIYDWYFPEWIVLAVMGGTAIVLCGLYAIEQVAELTTMRAFLASAAVGGPLFAWQVWLNRKRKKTREEVLRKRR